MKNLFQLTAIASLALSLTFSSASFATESIDQATTKLDNVVNNSLPSQYRDQLQSKIEDLKLQLAKLDLAFDKLENVTNNSIPSQYRDLISAKINGIKRAVSEEYKGSDSSSSEVVNNGAQVCDLEVNSGYYRLVKEGSQMAEFTLDLNKIIETKNVLTKAGLCSNIGIAAKCDLESNNGYWRTVRGGVGMSTFTLQQPEAIATLETIRRAGFCK